MKKNRNFLCATGVRFLAKYIRCMKLGGLDATSDIRR